MNTPPNNGHGPALLDATALSRIASLMFTMGDHSEHTAESLANFKSKILIVLDGVSRVNCAAYAASKLGRDLPAWVTKDEIAFSDKPDDIASAAEANELLACGLDANGIDWYDEVGGVELKIAVAGIALFSGLYAIARGCEDAAFAAAMRDGDAS